VCSGKMKWLLTVVLGLSFVFGSNSNARVNPFKKFKQYDFGMGLSWYIANDAAMKSGSVRDGSDINYYHININNNRLLLRLGKNDPSGELKNTRRLANMSIAEVKVDGRRLALFDWCLNHQYDLSRKLMQNTVVVNDICLNAGGGGDFIIKLDDETRNILKSASEIEFVIEPYGRPIQIIFNLQGYAPLIAKINKRQVAPKLDIESKKKPQHEPVIVESSQLKQVIVEAPKPLHVDKSAVAKASVKKVQPKPVKSTKPKKSKSKNSKAKPVVVKKVNSQPKSVAVKAEPKIKKKTNPVVVNTPKPIKMCYAKAPVDFRSAVPALKYPCNDKEKKEQAENNIKGSVKYEKRKIANELKAAKRSFLLRQKENQKTKRSVEWESEQTTMWVSRCKRHWARNRSPCYCEKYLKHAPRGVKNTCL